MLHGLEGRRILVAVLPDKGSARSQADVIRGALERVGAVVAVRDAESGNDDAWRGGMYAGVVVVGGDGAERHDPRLVQLVREFLASEKPVAALGGAVAAIIQAGGAAGRTLAAGANLKAAVESAGGRWVDAQGHADGCLVSAGPETDAGAFATQVVREFAQGLDEREVDTMEEQSFPASDPPSTTPGSIGAPDRNTGPQP